MNMAEPGEHGNKPVLRGGFADDGIGVADVEAEAEARVCDAFCNLDQGLRPGLHHIFHREEQIVRRVGQKLLPEGDRLLHIPLGIVDIGDEAAVDDDLMYAEALRGGEGLAETKERVGADIRVDGAGDELGKRRMQPEHVQSLQRRGDGGKDVLPLKIWGVAEGGNLISAVIFFRQRSGPGVHAGNMNPWGRTWTCLHKWPSSCAIRREKR